LSAPAQAVQRGPVRVIVDTNALFVVLQFRVDIVRELESLLNRRFELILLSPVRHELELLAKDGSLKTRKMASYALKLAGEFTFFSVPNDDSKTVDDLIVKVASNWKAPVFTNDSQLRKRLRDISVPVIYLRQKSRLEINGMI